MITSDRDIASEAWRCGSIPVPSDIFYERLIASAGKASQDREKGIELEENQGFPFEGKSEDFFPSTIRRGNPHRPSKKEKAIRRALNKL